MKLAAFVFFAVVAFAAAGRADRRRNSDYLQTAKPFTSEHVYRFRYDSQIATFLGSLDAVNGAQQATHRLSTMVNVHFDTHRTASLRLEDVRVASLNGELPELRQVQSIQFFDEEQIDSQKLEELQMPCTFELADGIVERIYFSEKDTAWSKNIKRAILNLMQINLKERNNQERIQGELASEDMPRMFNAKEITLEGECEVVYTINKVSALDSESNTFNVTKAIDFKQCSKLPTMRYGSRIERSISMPKHENSEELDRTTVFRYQLVGSADKYGIANVEALSQYVHKTSASQEIQTMQSTVASRLTIQSIEKSTQERVNRGSSKEESLLYSPEWDLEETRFYQYGDDEFNRETSPFKNVENKVKLVVSSIRIIAESATNKEYGMEMETALKLQNVVELLRMCNLEELKEIHSEVKSDERELNILIDACAIAGTRNTVHFLVEEIMNGDITTPKAVFILRQLNSLPVVSEKHIHSIVRLCKHNTESAPLRQACWLTAGSMIGQLCKGSIRDEKMCPRTTEEKYEKLLWDQYTEAGNQFDKIVALKAIGNAGNEFSVRNLETLISDRREPAMIRVQGIDALRRLRNEMPRKLQRVLLPIFKNTLEVPEVRMAAFSMLMHTIPDKAVIDQLAYSLHSERSNHIKSFVVSCFNAYSLSPVPEEREMALHLRTALTLAKVDLDMTSRYHRIPIYAGDKEDNLFINWANVFSTTDSLPKHIKLALDSFVNGLYNKDIVSVSLTQHNIEDLIHRFMQNWNQIGQRRSIRAERTSRNGEEELDSIFDQLKIQQRDGKTSFGIVNIRVHDLDQIVIPLDEEHMPTILKSILNGEKLTSSQVSTQLLHGTHFKLTSSLSVFEKSLKIATSSGMPLRVLHSLPIVGAVDGHVQLHMGSDNAKLVLKAQPMIAGVHVIKMEIWCPIINTGVESLRSAELNLPINMEATLMHGDAEEKVKIVLQVPEEKTRLVGLHSIPLTFTRQYNAKTNLHSNAKVKTIHNNNMQPRLRELLQTETSFSAYGHYYKPSQMTLSSLYQLAWATENNFRIEFNRREECAENLEITLSSKLFQDVKSSSAKPQFEDFYKNNKKFEPVYDDDVEGETESIDARGKRLDSYLSEEYKPRAAYRHFVKTEIKTNGGKMNHKATALLEATCDSQLSYCKISADVQRTPLLRGEKQDWELKAEGQFLAPEYVREVSELNEVKNHNKLTVTLNTKWGSEDMQKLNIKVQGERSVPQKWIQRSGMEWRRVLATAFINKYDVVADYKLTPHVQSQLEHYFALLKFWNYWNVDSTETMEGRSNEIAATLIIDPRTRQHVNISVKTPTERVRLTNVQLPMTIKPFTLVRPQQQKSDISSVDDMITEISDSGRAECRVDGRRVKTFDSVTYKAPIGSCYSVIAKDCAKKSFVILMKTIDEETDAKNIKIVTAKDTIEVELVRNKLVVKLNDEEVTSKRQLRESNIEYSEDFVRVMLPEGLSVRFDGKQVNVKLSHYFKKAQCGLCGEYNGEQHDEFRMNDNSLTDDVSSFHRSYSLINDECKNIYEKEELFGLESSQQNRDADGKWNDEAEEYDLFDRRETPEDEDENEPSLITKTMEYNHKICFSMKAVKQCPRGKHATSFEKMKVTYTCMDRSSPEGRRLLREARNSDISSKLSGLHTSFAETVQAAIVCA